MAWCLIPEHANKLKDDILKGRLTPDKLVEMGSEGRRKFFEERFGLDNAKEINASLEAKLIHKNITKGVEDWAKRLLGISESHRKDIFHTIEKNRDLLAQDYPAFKKDLISKRLGRDISHDEAGKILEFANKTKELEAKIPENSPVRSKERMDYGMQKAIYEAHLTELKHPKMRMKNLFKKEFYVDKAMAYVAHPFNVVRDATGMAKSILSSWDNSFFGRQGIRTLYRSPSICGKAFAKSWGDIARTLGHKGWSHNFDPMLIIKADIYSRPNAINGRYKKMGLDVGISGEEAYPTTAQDAVPILGRVFKASEAAFNGGALRMRADLADKFIALAEKQGVDLANKVELEGIGKMVNSLTGRGSIGKFEQFGKDINVLLFSVKYLKSIAEVLNPRRYVWYNGKNRLIKAAVGDKYTTFQRQQSAKNLMGMVAGMGGILALSEMLNPGSVQTDPRDKQHFAKVKVGKAYHDISGGVGGLISTIAQIVPTTHNGKWGSWRVNNKGQYINMWDNKFGQQTALDVAHAFIDNKAAPVMATVRDYLRHKHMTGEKFSLEKAGKQAITPIPLQNIGNIWDLKEDDFEKILSIALEELGSGTSVPYKKRR